MFSAQTYKDRRNALRESIQSGVVLLLGNEECGMNYASNVYRFRQDSTFLFYFGLDLPHLAALMDLDTGEEWLFGDDVTLDDIIWTGPQPSLQSLAARVHVFRTQPYAALAEKVAQARTAGRIIHFLPPYRGEHTLALAALLGLAPGELAGKSSLLLRQTIINQRLYKSDEELAVMEEAVRISCLMHEAALRDARPGMMEFQVAARMEAVASEHGCTLSFPTICTIHGETLHNSAQTHVLREGDLLLLDAGAETPEHYAGDISTTLPVSRTFTTQQKLVYRVTEQMHDTAVASLRPGIPFRDVYFRAAIAMVEGLKAIGLMKGDAEEAVHMGAHALFFPHGIGHALGLDVHDMENLGECLVGYGSEQQKSEQFGLRYLRFARPLEPRFVLTVEPGLYFIPALIDRWEAARQFTDFVCYDEVRKYIGFGGIRNEENHVITPDGARRLGPSLARTIETIEAWR